MIQEHIKNKLLIACISNQEPVGLYLGGQTGFLMELALVWARVNQKTHGVVPLAEYRPISISKYVHNLLHTAYLYSPP